jgi:hypothetical protein
MECPAFMNIVKNQHYVPRFYLERFAFEEEQIHVFDKTSGRCFPNNVKNVACEKYFYDIPDKYLWEGAEFQLIERQLSRMEDRFAPCRDEILHIVAAGHTFGEQLKSEFAEFVILQLLRTKTFRERHLQMGRLIQGIVQANPDLASGFVTPDDRVSLEHAAMMFSPDFSAPMREAILNHIWIIGNSDTEKLFYTSDSPVVRRATVRDSLMGTDGLASPGIQLYLPLTPKYILMLFERSVHKNLERLENSSFTYTDSRVITSLNMLQVYESYRQIYSNQGDFSDAVSFLKSNPEVAVAARPRVVQLSPPMK